MTYEKLHLPNEDTEPALGGRLPEGESPSANKNEKSRIIRSGSSFPSLPAR